MSNLIRKVRDALVQAGISPKKALSQNFLVNESVLDKQIEFANLTEDDVVIEIGGGTGVLTEKLAKKAKHLYCYEYDAKLFKYLQRKFRNITNVTIIHADILKVDLEPANKIIANLPYHISSPITFKLLDYGFDLAILMYQWEFALRMIAEPRTDDYSRLSANLQYQSNVEIMERVKKGHFYPIPKVDSALVKIIPKKEKLPVPVEQYRFVSMILFNTKNKLVSSVFYDFFKKVIPKEARFSFKKEIDSKILHATKRVRELSIEELVQITKSLTKVLQDNKMEKLLHVEAQKIRDSEVSL
ncbi:MAG: 16S rRNA (adenine(1518)-N(6)/adenine(1519)-N(6))-dimethyltransferase RsmA [Candidatus Heimdallarchaeota archaeon]